MYCPPFVLCRAQSSVPWTGSDAEVFARLMRHVRNLALVGSVVAIAGAGVPGVTPAGIGAIQPAPLKLTGARTTEVKPAHDVAAVLQEIGNVNQAQGVRFGATDNFGRQLGTIKIVAKPGGGYAGVYHYPNGAGFEIALATSNDLLRWTWVSDIGPGADPEIRFLNNGHLLLAWEAPSNTNPEITHVRVRLYSSLGTLARGHYLKQFDARHTFSTWNEGTPSINWTNATGSDIKLGFHYHVVNGSFNNDREATGELRNWTQWTAKKALGVDAKLTRLGAAASHGDRNVFRDGRGNTFTIYEGELRQNDFSSWRLYLDDNSRGRFHRINVQTPEHSQSFGNPTVTLLRDPRGRMALVTTAFIFGAANGPNEAGQAIWYREIG